MRERHHAEPADSDHSVRSVAPPVVRWIGVEDILAALREGIADFRAIPTHGVLFGLVYAVAGLVLARAAHNASLVPLVFPLVSGFALLGPFLAIGLYELSRRREQGLETRWWDAFGVRRHASFGAILSLGAALALLFVVWLWVAHSLFLGIVGSAPQDLGGFANTIFKTDAGWTLMIAGHAVGFVFAAVAFTCTVVSFPLLVDRDVDARAAVATSIRAVAANPGPMAVWAAIIAAGLILGSAPLLLGLPVVLPILGHASWHVYRRVVMP